METEGASILLSMIGTISNDTKALSEELHKLAALYENKDFLASDPSWFMHQVDGEENQEIMGFLASCLSYGNRKQFMPKIQFLLDCAGGDVYHWVKEGCFADDIPDDNTKCYYRLYNCAMMHGMLRALQKMLCEYGSMGKFVVSCNLASDTSGNKGEITCYDAVCSLTSFFAQNDPKGGIIPRNTMSACKRVCMFLRWMVRDNSPVDLGLWSGIIDKRTLIIPMDTHVLQQSVRLGLMQSKTASMTAAIKLSCKLREIFPDDPMKGDFALFGYGVNNK